MAADDSGFEGARGLTPRRLGVKLTLCIEHALEMEMLTYTIQFEGRAGHAAVRAAVQGVCAVLASVRDDGVAVVRVPEAAAEAFEGALDRAEGVAGYAV